MPLLSYFECQQSGRQPNRLQEKRGRKTGVARQVRFADKVNSYAD